MAKTIQSSEVDTIIIACEAGMGSSLMSVNALKKKLKKAKVTTVKVIHKPARDIPADAKVVVVHKSLAKVVCSKVPDAVVITFDHFFNDPAFEKLVDDFKEGRELTATSGS
jgi:mannitol-specific phosphotransferase system IIBC component